MCWRMKYEEITDGDQYWMALKQILPLAAFPVLFFVFAVPYSVYDVYYSFLTPTPNDILVFFSYMSISLWSLSSGVTLIVHIAVVRLPIYCTRLRATRMYMYGRSRTRIVAAPAGTETEVPSTMPDGSLKLFKISSNKV